MCEPTTLAVSALAISAMSGVMSAYGQYQTTKTQQEIEQKNYLAQANANLRNYEQQQNALTWQQNEINLQAMSEQDDLKRDLEKEKARLRVATGELGVGGILAERLQRTQDMEASLEASTIETNRQNKLAKAQYDKSVLRQGAKAPKLYQHKPDPAMAIASGALSIGSSAMSAYSGYKTQTALDKISKSQVK